MTEKFASDQMQELSHYSKKHVRANPISYIYVSNNKINKA
jgi:hypothetical protein